MVRLHRQRTFGGSRWPIVFLILSISSQSLVFSAETIPGVLQLDPTTTSNESTTLVYSTTNDVDHNAAETTTSQSPEEEIFLITATKKVEKDTRQRQLRPVYYGTPSGRALFSPRMEYNEWMPVGRGDPLKNDPTYDYSPPVLDRVRYWESGKDKSGDILLLGVSSKKSPAIPHRHSHHGSNAKENNYYGSKNPNTLPVRRNYYMQNLPTVLMPPPMQAPTQTPLGETWPIRMAVQDQSTGQTTYISVKSNNGPPHPNKLPYLHSILQKEITRPQPFSLKQHQPQLSTMMSPPPPQPPSSPAPFVMHHSQSIYESHSTQTTPLVPAHEIPMDHFMRPAGMKMPMGTMESAAIMGPTPLPMHAIQMSQVHFMTEGPMMSTTVPTTTQRPLDAMTTDSYFSHYNQPQQPIGGPMYLIIEGHSKVKTYGQGDEESAHAPKIVPVSPTEEAVITHVGTEHMPMVRHLHKKTSDEQEVKLTKNKEKLTESEAKEEKSKMGGLLGFIDSSLSDFMRAEEEDNSVLEDSEEKEKDTNKGKVQN